MKRLCLWFDEREKVSVREESLDPPGPGEVLVESLVSAISPGTEMLFYRGELESGVAVDSSLEGYGGRFAYPLRYGYASVGRIVRAGKGVEEGLVGRLAFAFVPHASAFTAAVEKVVLVPEGIEPESAAFLAASEIAVTLVLDARPLLGERASLFGLGIMGLMTAGLLSRFPLARLTAYDLHRLRREAAVPLGVDTVDPRERPPGRGTEDFVIELTGSPHAFRDALGACGYAGRLVAGSWYGTKGARDSRAPVLEAFDTDFHRNRVRIVSSQVSTIDPSLSGRWTKERRFNAAWEAIRSIGPSRWITHRVPFGSAADAYRLIADSPERTIQVMLVHETGPAARVSARETGRPVP